MNVTKVWKRRDGGYWCPDGNVTIPHGYGFLPAGDAPLTRAVRKTSGRNPLYMEMEKRRGRFPPKAVGIWAPQAIIDREKARLEALRTPEHIAKLARQRQRAEQRDADAFAQAIVDRFPGCPVEEAQVIAGWTCEVGSGRVGRSTRADDSVRAAVIAHIRHEHTEYERLLDDARESCVDRDEFDEIRNWACNEVWEEIERILRLWEQPPSDPKSTASGEVGSDGA